MDALTNATTTTNQVGEFNKPDEEQNIGTDFERTMDTFFRVMAAVQRNAIFRVMSGKDDEEKRQMAKEEINRFADFSMGPIGKCTPPRVWNEITGRCEFPQ